MRDLDVGDIGDAVARLAGEAAYRLGEAEANALKSAREREESVPGQTALDQILENARIAAEGVRPICQDTGLGVVFIDIGQEVHLTGGSLEEAVQSGFRRAVKEQYLRTSACDPFSRANTGDGAPAIVHTRIVPGDRVRIVFDAKGGGSENCSRLSMMTPADGTDGVKAFVLETVEKAGAKTCPPIVVGVGIGGNFETCAILAKRALVRDLGSANPDPDTASLEKDLLAAVNGTGVGPSGLGGRVTALAVHVETAHCHIASLPVAVNLDCHAHRHGEVTL